MSEMLNRKAVNRELEKKNKINHRHGGNSHEISDTKLIDILGLIYYFFCFQCQSGGMADATDSKSVELRLVRVQVPSLAPSAFA